MKKLFIFIMPILLFGCGLQVEVKMPSPRVESAEKSLKEANEVLDARMFDDKACYIPKRLRRGSLGDGLTYDLTVVNGQPDFKCKYAPADDL